MLLEDWRPVKDFEGIYEVSNLGNVRSIRTGPNTFIGKLLKPSPNQWGYKQVCLRDMRRYKMLAVHKLVASAFLFGPLSENTEVNHIDTDKSNNRVDNLEYTTRSGNMLHCYATGIHSNPKGSNHPASRLNEHQVIDIRLIHSKGDTIASIAKLFDVSESTVRLIVKRKTWIHI